MKRETEVIKERKIRDIRTLSKEEDYYFYKPIGIHYSRNNNYLIIMVIEIKSQITKRILTQNQTLLQGYNNCFSKI